jgi:hypothetical protein
MMNDNDRNSGRSSDGRFAAGNPGRIPGVKNRATRLAEVLFDGSAEEICNVVIDAAKSGDMVAARLVIERICPPRKDRPISFHLPEVETSDDSNAAMAGLISSVAAGEVTPEEGNVVASLIEKHVRIRETSDFEARLKALEERFGHGESR